MVKDLVRVHSHAPAAQVKTGDDRGTSGGTLDELTNDRMTHSFHQVGTRCRRGDEPRREHASAREGEGAALASGERSSATPRGAWTGRRASGHCGIIKEGMRSSNESTQAPLQQLEAEILERAAKDALPIPPYPAVALQVQRLASRTEVGLAELARLVGLDATLAADVLRCANSAVYRRGDAVTNLTQAVTRIGAQEVRRIAITSGLAAHVQGGGLASLKRSVWIESVTGALLCQHLGLLRGARGEDAFTVGLLHDFGKVIALTCIESMLREGKEPTPRPLQDWVSIVDHLHVALGQAMGLRWGLPSALCQVIALHHGETSADWEICELLEVVRTADQVVGMLGTRPHVTSVDLATIPMLRHTAARSAIARLVAKLPGFIAAFEGAGGHQPAQRSWIASPRTTLAPGERPAAFTLRLTAARRALEYAVDVLAPNGLSMSGEEPVIENYLVEALLLCQRPTPFVMWAVPRLCRAEGAGFRVELQPFALGREARKLWNRLYMNA